LEGVNYFAPPEEFNLSNNLIIKSSYTKLPNGKLKSNFGDLIRSTILVNCLEEDFLWVTDRRAKDLLKCFVRPSRIITLEDLDSSLEQKNIYNLDNYILNENFFRKLKGEWKGFKYNGEKVSPENSLLASTIPYFNHETKKSWQQCLVEGLGFEWMEQDFLKPRIYSKDKDSIDIGLNYHVHPEWISKAWKKESWEELSSIIQNNYSFSWQEGLDNFQQYYQWMNSCKLIITNDTLGLHLASALRKKVIAITGPTDNREFSYGRISFAKPPPRECMPCESPRCKINKPCLDEVIPQEITTLLSEIL